MRHVPHTQAKTLIKWMWHVPHFLKKTYYSWNSKEIGKTVAKMKVVKVWEGSFYSLKLLPPPALIVSFTIIRCVERATDVLKTI